MKEEKQMNRFEHHRVGMSISFFVLLYGAMVSFFAVPFFWHTSYAIPLMGITLLYLFVLTVLWPLAENKLKKLPA